MLDDDLRISGHHTGLSALSFPVSYFSQFLCIFSTKLNSVRNTLLSKGRLPKKNPEKVWSFAKPGGKQKTKPQVFGKQKTKPQVCKCVFFFQ